MSFKAQALAAGVGLGLLAGAAPALAANLVVVEARGIGLKPGAMVDDAKPLNLLEGQHVTLIAANGATIKIDGPFDRTPAAARSGGSGVLVQALAALGTQSGARTSEEGVTRAGTQIPRLPSPWLLDVSRTGRVCLQEGEKPIFWRPTAARRSDMTVTAADRSWKAETNWPEGSDQMLVPPALPVHGGSTYLVSLGKGAEAAVTVELIPAALDSDAMRVAWMAHRGCEAQAEALQRAAK
jgi:hypothetical protein